MRKVKQKTRKKRLNVLAGCSVKGKNVLEDEMSS